MLFKKKDKKEETQNKATSSATVAVKDAAEEKAEKRNGKKVEKFKIENGVAISIKNMNLFYGSFQALKNINMEIPEKKITAFIGPSGCGKSTLIKSLNRMNDLVEGCKITGEIKIGDTDIYVR